MARIGSLKTTEFKFYAPTAKKVSLAGSFNNWDMANSAAKKDSKGNWIAKVNLKPGRYEYKFFVDGAWINDPHCTTCIVNSFGSKNCVITVK